MMEFDYENLRRLNYGGASFVPVCPKCGRFVKGDPVIRFDIDGPPVDGPTATCKRCGRVEMPFEGYV
jgi:hypothetical protein